MCGLVRKWVENGWFSLYWELAAALIACDTFVLDLPTRIDWCQVVDLFQRAVDHLNGRVADRGTMCIVYR